MCVFPSKGKKTAEERKKGKDNYCRERERERERERISTKHTNLFDDTTTTTTKAELGRSFFRRASREAFFLEKGKKRARGCPSLFFFFFSFLIFGGRIPILSLSLFLGEIIVVSSFEVARSPSFFPRTRALTLLICSQTFKRSDRKNVQQQQRRKRKGVPTGGCAINHQHPRHRPTGEQLQATEKRRQRSDENVEQRHLRIYRVGGRYRTTRNFVALTSLGGR